MDRRLFVMGIGVTIAGSARQHGGLREATPRGDSSNMEKPAFVLVHGAWHGGWCWKKLSPILRAAGHEVYTPTLTGLGERVHLLAPDIDLATHINDVVNLLEYEDLQNVVLVGHSYGGMVISGVANQAGPRIGHVAYLDAFLPEDGKALRDYAPGDVLDEMANTQGGGWRLPSYMGAKDFGITDAADAAWVDARLGDQPYKTFTQRLDLAGTTNSAIGRSYILTTTEPFTSHAERARQQGFDSFELFSAGHDSMVTQPNELAEILRDLTR